MEFDNPNEVDFENVQDFYFAIAKTLENLPNIQVNFDQNELRMFGRRIIDKYIKLQATRNGWLPPISYVDLYGLLGSANVTGATSCKEDVILIADSFNRPVSSLYRSALQLDTIAHEVAHGGTKICRIYPEDKTVLNEAELAERSMMETSATLYAKDSLAELVVHDHSIEAFYALLMGLQDMAFECYFYQALKNDERMASFKSKMTSSMKNSSQKDAFTFFIMQVNFADKKSKAVFRFLLDAYGHGPMDAMNRGLYQDGQVKLLKSKGLPNEFEMGYINFESVYQIMNNLDWWVKTGIKQLHRITPQITRGD